MSQFVATFLATVLVLVLLVWHGVVNGLAGMVKVVNDTSALYR